MGLTDSGDTGLKKSDDRTLRRRLKQAEREILRLQRERDDIAARRAAEVDALKAQLAEALAAREPLIVARDAAVATLESERRDWRAEIARVLDERNRAIAAAERARDEALARRDEALEQLEVVTADCERRVRDALATRDRDVAAARAETAAAVAARDIAVTKQRQSECYASALTAERDRAVSGWSRAEAELRSTLNVTDMLPSTGVAPQRHEHMPHLSRHDSMDSVGDPVYVPPTPVPPMSPPVSHSQAFGTFSSPPHVPVAAQVRQLLQHFGARGVADVSVREQACRALTHIDDACVDAVALALMPGLVWPIRAPPLLEGEYSRESWLRFDVPDGWVASDSTAQLLPAAALQHMQHNALYSLVGDVVTAGPGVRDDRVGTVRPLTLSSVSSSVASMDLRHVSAGLVDAGRDGASCAVTFLVAVGSNVCILRGLVPGPSGFRDPNACAEIVVASRLGDGTAHRHVVHCVHCFEGSSVLVRPWVSAALLATLPQRVPYLLLPHYPVTLAHLVLGRRASGRPSMTELEMLLVAIQMLSALLHLATHGFVHRNVSVCVVGVCTPLCFWPVRGSIASSPSISRLCSHDYLLQSSLVIVIALIA
jgi:hypothetical protein